MERRSLFGILALVAVVVVIGLLVLINNRGTETEETAAFAPAQSADESVPPPDETLQVPADAPAEAGDETAGEVVVVEDGADVESEAEDASADEGSETDPPAAAEEPEAGDTGEADVAAMEPVAGDEATPADEAASGDEAALVDEAASVEEAAPAEDAAETVAADDTTADDAASGEVAETGVAALEPDAGEAMDDAPAAGEDMPAETAEGVADATLDTEPGPADTEIVEATVSDEEIAAPEDMAAAETGEADADGTSAELGNRGFGGITADATDMETPGAGAEPAEETAIAALPEGDATAELGSRGFTGAPADVAEVEAEAEPLPEVEAEAEPLPEETVVAALPEDGGVAAEAEPLEIAVPTFDVVRVEPSGDMVVAGTAEPDSTVELLDGVEPIATATANTRGEWAMALDEPLSPGTHDLAIRTLSASRSIAMLSDQRVAVSVPERGSEDVLVVLNQPEGASDVLQVPEAEPTETVVAMAEPETPGDAGDEGTVAEDEAAETAEVAEAGEGTATDDAVVETTGIAAAEQPDAVEAVPETGDETVAGADSSGGMDSSGMTVDTAEAQPESGQEAVEPEPAPEVVEAEPEPVAPPEPVRMVAVTAIEADTAGALFVAGEAETADAVRVYLDEEFIAETRPTPGGTWLVEVQHEVPPGSYQVRADQVSSAGEVLVRAEVPFEREVKVAVLEPVAETGAATGAATGARAAGELPKLRKVIIKKGDNLWRISREIFGRGIRYSVIYEANRDQIRNPHWIYPGQVFLLPEGDVSWEGEPPAAGQ